LTAPEFREYPQCPAAWWPEQTELHEVVEAFNDAVGGRLDNGLPQIMPDAADKLPSAFWGCVQEFSSAFYERLAEIKSEENRKYQSELERMKRRK